MEDGVFFDDCYDALEHWDDDWVLCPVCLGRVVYEINEAGQTTVKVAHLKYNTTEQ